MSTQKEVGEHLDISDRQVRNLIKDGVLPAAKGPGGLHLESCRKAYIHYLRHLASSGKVTVEQDDFEEGSLEYERYRLTKAQADSQELKNQIATQEVVPADFATYALAKVAAEASGVIDSLPLNIIRKHPELTTIQTENIKRELAKALNALSRLERSLPEILDDYIRETTE
ncbi:terminase small subunit [Vibrio sp. C8]